MNKRSEMRPVVGMDSFKEFGCGKTFLWIEAKDLRSVVAALRGVSLGIPFESHYPARSQRLLKSRLALKESGLVMTPLSEKRSKNERAERDGQDAGLGAHDALIDRDTRVAEITDAESGHPNQCKSNNECSC